MADVCPACGVQVDESDHYCEACGQDLLPELLSTLELPAVVAASRWLISTDVDRTELDLGSIAAATDLGLRHHRNEDAVGLGQFADTVIAVVCDGVSSSTNPGAASTGAVAAATTALLGALGRGESVVDAIATATQAAQTAAALAAGSEPDPNPPSSTFVCAVVAPDRVSVGWVGDSRAYWLPDEGAAVCLTVDDSVAGRAQARGATLPPGVSASQAGTLVRWLGADATDTAPHVRGFAPSGPGRVLVCSDGLFKYRPDPAALAAATPHDTPLETVRALVRLALAAGGADNVSAAVLPYPPVASSAAPFAESPTGSSAGSGSTEPTTVPIVSEPARTEESRIHG